MNYYNEELFKVCKEGNRERLKEMIREGVYINQTNHFKENCLFDACRSGNKEIVEILIKIGIDIHQVNDFGKNCLFSTCLYKDKEIIKILIENGIEIQYNMIYETILIEEKIKEYVKELVIKRELKENYI